jgi:hypothetical protein
MTRAQQQQGKLGEQAAEYALKALGVLCLEKINVNRVGKSGVYQKKVSADFYGLTPTGQGVRVEVKTIDANLKWSNFREHQPDALTEYMNAGGLALVAWVHGSAVYVMRWRDMLAHGFRFGASITPDIALKIHVTRFGNG